MLLIKFFALIFFNIFNLHQDDCDCKSDIIYGYKFEVKTQIYQEFLLELIIKVENPYNNKSIMQKIKTDDDASIAKCWLTDLDDDLKPEIIIWCISSGSGVYGTLYVYEFDPDRMKLSKIDLYVLQERDYRQGYQGHDNFCLEGRYVLHSFPIYKEDDSNCCPTGGLLIIIYALRNNKFEVVKEIKLP